MRSYIERAEEFMNFYDFNGMRGYGNQSAENGKNKQNSCNFAGQNCDTESKNQSFEDKFAEYSQKSEEELTARLMDVARRMKAQGTFDAQSLENLYNNAYPMLNDEQRRRMRSIIDMLKA